MEKSACKNPDEISFDTFEEEQGGWIWVIPGRVGKRGSVFVSFLLL